MSNGVAGGDIVTFRYDMIDKTKRQQAMVRQRDREEQRRKKESEKQIKAKKKRSLEYEFDYESVKSELSEKELSYFMDYVHKYKGTIIQEVLRNERLQMRDLETPLEIGETDLGKNYLQSVYKTFQFTKVDDYVIKITKIT